VTRYHLRDRSGGAAPQGGQDRPSAPLPKCQQSRRCCQARTPTSALPTVPERMTLRACVGRKRCRLTSSLGCLLSGYCVNALRLQVTADVLVRRGVDDCPLFARPDSGWPTSSRGAADQSVPSDGTGPLGHAGPSPIPPRCAAARYPVLSALSGDVVRLRARRGVLASMNAVPRGVSVCSTVLRWRWVVIRPALRRIAA
jgi:hypothetical protein